MPQDEQPHECDLFLFSSHSEYQVNRSLKAFARLGSSNTDGWGIGYYRDDQSRVIRSSEPACDPNVRDPNRQVAKELQCACDLIESKVVISHLRRISRGNSRVENNHPFKLHFLDNDWLMIHNGTASRNDLVPRSEQLILNSDSDSPRIFEFLRSRIIDYMEGDPRHSLIEAVRSAFSALLEADPRGSFNIILTNGYLSFAFIHWRDFYLFSNEKASGNTIRLTTLNLDDGGPGGREPLIFKALPGKKAKMLVFSGETLVFNGDIPK